MKKRDWNYLLGYVSGIFLTFAAFEMPNFPLGALVWLIGVGIILKTS